jgi:hypothetical protein
MSKILHKSHNLIIVCKFRKGIARNNNNKNVALLGGEKGTENLAGSWQHLRPQAVS